MLHPLRINIHLHFSDATCVVLVSVEVIRWSNADAVIVSV